MERTCQNCKYAIHFGGDAIPYGSTTAYLPLARECDNPDMPEDALYWDMDTEPEDCNYFEAREIGTTENFM